MKIVILDGYAMNPGDLDWAALHALGDVVIHDRTDEAQVIEQGEGADALLTNKVPISRQVIDALPQLKYIGVMATGYNIIALDRAKERDIVVTNVPGYSTTSVVQLTFSLLLELCFRTQRHSDAVKKGKWSSSPDFCFWDYPLVELSGKKLGIIGLGSIGQKVADVASAFGMEVLAFSRTQTDQSHRQNFRWVSLDELFTEADVVTLHCPLTEATANMIDRRSLAQMKSSAVLINTSRGGLVHAQDLADALNAGKIRAAGLDVLEKEPPVADHPLFTAKNCLITPHIAWATHESRVRLMATVVDNFKAFLEGHPVNLV
ncbi:D-2-hydroxyacid dehydrogenase [Sphingobacterium sp. SGG-5]|nr:D-2-hydroxyacid dehydrogenase [Sphingobacterium sp. SGG-5]